jgi:hypothetical protein
VRVSDVDDKWRRRQQRQQQQQQPQQHTTAAAGDDGDRYEKPTTGTTPVRDQGP